MCILRSKNMLHKWCKHQKMAFINYFSQWFSFTKFGDSELPNRSCIVLPQVSENIPPPTPPFLDTTLRQKWGGDVCSNIQFVSCIHPLPPFVTILNTHEVDSQGFLEDRQFLWTCNYGNFVMLLLILSQEGQSNLHHRHDRERSCISLRSQFELEIPWQWLANKNIVILCMCLLTQSIMMLNQKLTKSIIRRCSKRGIYIKKGGERLPEGRVF